jgi:hypothetical protein
MLLLETYSVVDRFLAEDVCILERLDWSEFCRSAIGLVPALVRGKGLNIKNGTKCEPPEAVCIDNDSALTVIWDLLPIFVPRYGEAIVLLVVAACQLLKLLATADKKLFNFSLLRMEGKWESLEPKDRTRSEEFKDEDVFATATEAVAIPVNRYTRELIGSTALSLYVLP